MQLRYYQEEAVEALFHFFETHGGTDANGLPIKANPLICLPTGTGKSLVIAEAIRRAFAIYPKMRVIMSTHVKELIKQNANAMVAAWPQAPIGIYSAGLKTKQFMNPITFGGVQSMAGQFPIFGYRDWLVIDEAHLLGNEGRYVKFIEELIAKNPYLKVIGLTATPYRMKLGHLTNGEIFTHSCYDLTNIDGFNRLIAQSYLAPLISKPTHTIVDTSNVGISSTGDYVESELEAEIDKVTVAALEEFMHFGKDRQSWAIFTAGVKNANTIAEYLNAKGISTVAIHSKQKADLNDYNLKAWKTGVVQCAVSMNQLTTGIDHPALDYIGVLRATLSTGLWVQMLGRGTRPFEGNEVFQPKTNCIVMDFARNTIRLGPINDPVIPRFKNKGEPGNAPVRICEVCSTYNHARATECCCCGFVFPVNIKIDKTASTAPILRSDLPQIKDFDVRQQVLTKHISKSTGREMIKVSYYCGLRTFYEYISVEGGGLFAKRGRDWYRQRFPGEPPPINSDILNQASMLRSPSTLKVWINRKNPEIVGTEF